jgi:ABC-type bacteriocin/lantibiotic exporter with double-glycine peptidase domain
MREREREVGRINNVLVSFILFCFLPVYHRALLVLVVVLFFSHFLIVVVVTPFFKTVSKKQNSE